MLTQRNPITWTSTVNRDGEGVYYISRDGHGDYAGYWGEVRDPDGKIRSRVDEWMPYLDDIAEELAYLSALPQGDILDIGCGLGWLLDAMPAGWNRYGTELSPEAVTYCESNGITMLDPSLNFRGQFDVVVMHHVIEHMPDPCGAIRKVHRLLRHGGVLLIATPDFASPCAVRFGKRYRLLHDQTHISLFSNESMHRFLWDHGFDIERVSYPFPERFANDETWSRWGDTSKVSPPWPGNFMTFYCRKGDE